MVDRIREEIATSDLAKGNRVVVAQLARRWNLKREAVRNVVSVLEADGLIVRGVGRGLLIRMQSVDELVEASEVRAALEGLCAERAAGVISGDDRLQFRTVGTVMRTSVAEGDVDGYFMAARILHRRIAAVSRQAAVREALTLLEFRSLRRLRQVVDVPGRLTCSLVEHLGIIDSILSGDVERAGASVRAHWSAVGEVARRSDRMASPTLLMALPS